MVLKVTMIDHDSSDYDSSGFSMAQFGMNHVAEKTVEEERKRTGRITDGTFMLEEDHWGSAGCPYAFFPGCTP